MFHICQKDNRGFDFFILIDLVRREVRRICKSIKNKKKDWYFNRFM